MIKAASFKYRAASNTVFRDGLQLIYPTSILGGKFR
jgi:hypothetical protein